jgi:hypothetical protein
VPTLVTPGDRQILLGGSTSLLKRNSVPFSMFTGNVINRSGGGTLSYQQLYETQPWAHTIINKLNRQIARLPLKVFRFNDNGDRERVRVGIAAGSVGGAVCAGFTVDAEAEDRVADAGAWQLGAVEGAGPPGFPADGATAAGLALSGAALGVQRRPVVLGDHAVSGDRSGSPLRTCCISRGTPATAKWACHR